MGIDDRDYMRERYRKRQGLDPGAVEWNDKKSRRELRRSGYHKAVPLGSAGWISGLAGKTSWFEKTRGLDYQKGRRRSRLRSFRKDRTHRYVVIGLAVAMLLYLGTAGRTWLADRLGNFALPRFGQGFPATGAVVVPSTLDLKRVKSRLTLQGSAENSIVQLIDARTGLPALSIYVRAHERTSLAVPIGQFRVRLIHGREWVSNAALFGKATVHDEIVGVMPFTRRLGHVLDLGLGPDSHLTIRPATAKPVPLT
ncbi:hypothetical protein J2Y58_003528 [Sphingomonas sp. BE138]|uniref:hypothetical protein n=1 Tax=Sphingomonas sp. BE138 TaxID=2817845 RepID=UPI00285B0F42|nr:hypothetical protein [Sphingomonas sp. BE138]MDR6790148.1 hypothetical protein [Sphingomonas sp. BE138]